MIIQKLIFILLVKICSASIIHIPADYATIQNGIDNANTGDTLHIATGVYEEDLIIFNKNLTLQSSYIYDFNNNHITGTNLISLSNPAILINNSNVTIIGISIASNYDGINIQNSNLNLYKTILYNAYNQGYALNLNNSFVQSQQSTIFGFEYSITGNFNSNVVINSSILWPYNKIIYSISPFSEIKYSCIKDNNYDITLSNNITDYPFLEQNALYELTGETAFNIINNPWRTEYPWQGNSWARYDGYDNNPWNSPYDQLITAFNYSGQEVRIGNGEANDTGDPDNDGVMGEDWINGYDDDGDCIGDTNLDGLICGPGDQGVDEDAFFADGIDNDGDCIGDTNLDGLVCGPGDQGVDENIDEPQDQWLDGVDNNRNGYIDETAERYSGGFGSMPNWADDLENRNIIVYQGRENYLINGQKNPWYINTDVFSNKHLRGEMIYVENIDSLLFDVYNHDFGDDGLPGDNSWNDQFGDSEFTPYEGGNTILYQGSYIAIPTEGCLESPFTGNGECDNFEQAFFSDIFIPTIHDCGLDGFCPDDDWYPGPDYGESNGVWDSFDWNQDGNYTGGDMWNSGLGEWQDDNGNGIPDENDSSLEWFDNFPYADGIWNEVGADGILGTYDDEQLLDCGQDGLCFGDVGYPGPDPGEGDEILLFIDNNELDGVFDTGDGCFGCDAEPFFDSNYNGFYDESDPFTDTNDDSKWTPADYTPTWRNITYMQNLNLAHNQTSSYYMFSKFVECGEHIDVQNDFARFNDIDDNFNSDDYTDLNNNNQPDPYEPGVNADGFIYADGIDNDGDGLDIDGDGYPYFQEIRQQTDPNDPLSFPSDSNGVAMFIADWSWAVDELIDENYCTDSFLEEYYGLVPNEFYSGLRNGSYVFNISPISSLLDGGDPLLSNDKDSTIADIGALSYLYPYYGCTDPEALNYNFFTIEDNGSCEYRELCCVGTEVFDNWGNNLVGVPFGLQPYSGCNYCYDILDGIDNDLDWNSQITWPFFSNNLNTINSEVYSSEFEIDFDTPIYNIDTDGDGQMDAFDWSLSQGFDWTSDESTLGEFGYVDYIRCPGYGQNYWNGGYSDIDGLSEYCANNNFGGGDTIGITLYHPEDVISHSQVIEIGYIYFGAATEPAQFWDAVGVDEYHVLYGIPSLGILPEIEFTEYINPEPIINDNGNSEYDEYFYNAETDSLDSETYIDINNNGKYDSGGWQAYLTWNDLDPLMIEINDEFYPIFNTNEFNVHSNYLENIVTVNSLNYTINNIQENTLVCSIVEPLNNSIFLNYEWSVNCIMSPEWYFNNDLAVDSEIPKSYKLSNNYPNPFNPVTTIEYSIPKNTYVKFIIFDIRGRKIEDLYQGYHAPGDYSIQWNAKKYASGVYFLSMQTDDFKQVQKMTLIK